MADINIIIILVTTLPLGRKAKYRPRETSNVADGTGWGATSSGGDPDGSSSGGSGGTVPSQHSSSSSSSSSRLDSARNFSRRNR